MAGTNAELAEDPALWMRRKKKASDACQEEEFPY